MVAPEVGVRLLESQKLSRARSGASQGGVERVEHGCCRLPGVIEVLRRWSGVRIVGSNGSRDRAVVLSAGFRLIPTGGGAERGMDHPCDPLHSGPAEPGAEQGDVQILNGRRRERAQRDVSEPRH